MAATLGDLLRARMSPEAIAMYKTVHELMDLVHTTKMFYQNEGPVLGAANLLLAQHAMNKAQEIRLRELGVQFDNECIKSERLERQIRFLKHIEAGQAPGDSLEKRRIKQLEQQVEKLQADLKQADDENQRQAEEIKRIPKDLHTVILSDLKHRIVALENQLTGATRQIELAETQRDVYKEQRDRYHSLFCEIRDTMDNSNLI